MDEKVRDDNGRVSGQSLLSQVLDLATLCVGTSGTTSSCSGCTPS